MLLVALLVLEEPYIDDVVRILGEVGLLEQVDRPLDGLLRSALDHPLGFVTDHDERFLDHNVELLGPRQPLAQPGDVRGVVERGLRGTCGRLRLRAGLGTGTRFILRSGGASHRQQRAFRPRIRLGEARGARRERDRNGGQSQEAPSRSGSMWRSQHSWGLYAAPRGVAGTKTWERVRRFADPLGRRRRRGTYTTG